MTKTMMTLFAVALLPTSALAGDGDPKTVEVYVDAQDLDLASSTGREILDSRINDAARSVCRRAFRADALAPHHVRYCRRVVTQAANGERDVMLAGTGDEGNRYLGLRFDVTIE